MKTQLTVLILCVACFTQTGRAETTWAAPAPREDLVIVSDEDTGPKSIKLPLPPLPPLPGVAWKGPFPVPSFLVAQADRPGRPPHPPIVEPLVKQMEHDVALVRQNADKLRMKIAGQQPEEHRLMMIRKLGAPQSSFVPVSRVDEAVQDEIEEDLNIMSHLLGSAIAEAAQDKEDRRAMGIEIRSLPFGAPRGLQLEGYGALFEAHVPFPLQSEGAQLKAEKPNTDATSEWELARRRVYDPGAERAEVQVHGPEYDAGRVEALKAGILKALGNAGNMRHLESKDFITVAVRSGGAFTYRINAAGKPMLHEAKPDSRAGTPARGPEPRAISKKAGPGGSVLTIRVKKSDADALAKGDINAEEFRKRALVVVN